MSGKRSTGGVRGGQWKGRGGRTVRLRRGRVFGGGSAAVCGLFGRGERLVVEARVVERGAGAGHRGAGVHVQFGG